MVGQRGWFPQSNGPSIQGVCSCEFQLPCYGQMALVDSPYPIECYLRVSIASQLQFLENWFETVTISLESSSADSNSSLGMVWV